MPEVTQEIRERTNRAPLAQLRDVDEDAWKILMAAGSTADPDHTTVVQAMAADLMGAHDLAALIREHGFYPLAAGVLGEWPDWTKGPIITAAEVCEHPLTSFQVIEDGYTRTWHTRIDEDEKVIHAFFSGTEDWSDEGSGEYLVCTECAQTRPLPSDYELDWQ